MTIGRPDRTNAARARVAATEGFCCSVDDCGDSWPPVDFFSAGAAFSFLMTGSFGIVIVN